MNTLIAVSGIANDDNLSPGSEEGRPYHFVINDLDSSPLSMAYAPTALPTQSGEPDKSETYLSYDSANNQLFLWHSFETLTEDIYEVIGYAIDAATGLVDTEISQQGILDIGFDFSNDKVIAAVNSSFSMHYYVLASANNEDGAYSIVKFKNNGDLETNFGRHGVANLPKQTDAVDSIEYLDFAEQSDGTLVVVGSGQDVSSTDSAGVVMSYTSSGDLKTTFNNSLTTYTENSGAFGASLLGLVIDPNDNIYLIGSTYIYDGNNYTDSLVVKLDSGGELDKNFANLGKLIADFGGLSELDSAQQVDYANDALYVSGTIESSYEDPLQIYLTKINSITGVIDISFASNGVFVASSVDDLTFQYEPKDIKVDSQGRIFVLVDSIYEFNFTLKTGLMRFLSDGSLDTTFGQNGMHVLELGDEYRTSFASEPTNGLSIGTHSVGAEVIESPGNSIFPAFVASPSVAGQLILDEFDRPLATVWVESPYSSETTAAEMDVLLVRFEDKFNSYVLIDTNVSENFAPFDLNTPIIETSEGQYLLTTIETDLDYDLSNAEFFAFTVDDVFSSEALAVENEDFIVNSDEDDVVNIAVDFGSADANTLDITFEVTPVGLQGELEYSVNATDDGLVDLQFIPAENQSGVAIILLHATDGVNEVYTLFVVRVDPVDDAPVLVHYDGVSANSEITTSLSGYDFVPYTEATTSVNLPIRGCDLEGDDWIWELVTPAISGGVSFDYAQENVTTEPLVDIDCTVTSTSFGPIVGPIVYTPNSGFEGSDSFVVRIAQTDNAQLATDLSVSLTVDSYNHAPVINIQKIVISEATPDGSSIGHVSVTDENAGDSFTYTLLDNQAPPYFTINSSTGEITTTADAQFNYESDILSHLVTVTVFDDDTNNAKSTTQTIEIEIDDIEEKFDAAVANGGVFNHDYFATVENNRLAKIGHSLVVDSDESLYLVGSFGDSTSKGVSFSKHTETGHLDNNFGHFGQGNIQTASMTVFGEYANTITHHNYRAAVGTEVNGNWFNYKVGYVNYAGSNQILISKYDHEGALYDDFGLGGHIIVTIGTTSEAYSVKIYDGKLYVAGFIEVTTGDKDYWIGEFQLGHSNTATPTASYLISNTSDFNEEIYDFELYKSGVNDIAVFVGTTNDINGGLVSKVHLTGSVATLVSNYSLTDIVPYALTLGASNEPYVAGKTTNNATASTVSAAIEILESDLSASLLTSPIVLDNGAFSYGFNAGFQSRFYDIALGNDDSLYAVGQVTNHNAALTSSQLVAKITLNDINFGQFDSTFINEGVYGFNHPRSINDEAVTLALVTDATTSEQALYVAGNMVLNGDSVETTEDATLAKFSDDGLLQSSFGGDGIISVNHTKEAADIIHSAVLTPDTSYLVGYTKTPTESLTTVGKANASNEFDANFAEQGELELPNIYRTDTTDEIGLDVYPLSDGRVFILTYHGNLGVRLQRFLVDGAEDPSFVSQVVDSTLEVPTFAKILVDSASQVHIVLQNSSTVNPIAKSYHLGGTALSIFETPTTAPFNFSLIQIYSALLDSSDDILIIGEADGEATVIKATADEAATWLDSSFATNGQWLIGNIATNQSIESPPLVDYEVSKLLKAKELSNGGYLFVGTADPVAGDEADLLMVKLTSGGLEDFGFGRDADSDGMKDGLTVLDGFMMHDGNEADFSTPLDLHLYANDSALIVGALSNLTDDESFIAKVTQFGTLDTRFTNEGYIVRAENGASLKPLAIVDDGDDTWRTVGQRARSSQCLPVPGDYFQLYVSAAMISSLSECDVFLVDYQVTNTSYSPHLIPYDTDLTSYNTSSSAFIEYVTEATTDAVSYTFRLIDATDDGQSDFTAVIEIAQGATAADVNLDQSLMPDFLTVTYQPMVIPTSDVVFGLRVTDNQTGLDDVVTIKKVIGAK